MLQKAVESRNGSDGAQSMDKPAGILGVSKNGVKNTAWTRTTWCRHEPDLDMGRTGRDQSPEQQLHPPPAELTVISPCAINGTINGTIINPGTINVPSLQDGAPEAVVSQMVQYNPTEYLWKVPGSGMALFAPQTMSFQWEHLFFPSTYFMVGRKSLKEEERVITDEYRISLESKTAINSDMEENRRWHKSWLVLMQMAQAFDTAYKKSIINCHQYY